MRSRYGFKRIISNKVCFRPGQFSPVHYVVYFRGRKFFGPERQIVYLVVPEPLIRSCRRKISSYYEIRRRCTRRHCGRRSTSYSVNITGPYITTTRCHSYKVPSCSDICSKIHPGNIICCPNQMISCGVKASISYTQSVTIRTSCSRICFPIMEETSCFRR